MHMKYVRYKDNVPYIIANIGHGYRGKVWGAIRPCKRCGKNTFVPKARLDRQYHLCWKCNGGPKRLDNAITGWKSKAQPIG